MSPIILSYKSKICRTCYRNNQHRDNHYYLGVACKWAIWPCFNVIIHYNCDAFGVRKRCFVRLRQQKRHRRTAEKRLDRFYRHRIKADDYLQHNRVFHFTIASLILIPLFARRHTKAQTLLLYNIMYLCITTSCGVKI